MKIFKFLAVALVAIVGLNSCSKDCDHEFIEYAYNKALVGTWTCLEDGGLAEAMVIKADGSFAVTGIMAGGYMYESKGSINVVNNKVSLVFEGDTDVIEGRLELVAGKSLSIVINEEYDIRLTYDYCDNDLSDEIVGLWVATDGPYMSVEKFTEDGKALYTGYVPESEEMVVNSELTYKVIGDLQFHLVAVDGEEPIYVAHRLVYFPNYTTKLGDTMTWQTKEGISFSRLRIKEELNLTGKTYDYSSAYVTNAKGKDEDFSILGHTFNIAKIGAGDFDMMLRSVLFCLDTDANSIKQHFLVDGVEGNIETPIAVDGNKVTIDYSDVNPALRKVEMYMFQDADDSQLHMYMHTDAFINYFANLEVVTLLQAGKINQSDAAAVEKVFADMEARVESINVSFVLKVLK